MRVALASGVPSQSAGFIAGGVRRSVLGVDADGDQAIVPSGVSSVSAQPAGGEGEDGAAQGGAGIVGEEQHRRHAVERVAEGERLAASSPKRGSSGRRRLGGSALTALSSAFDRPAWPGSPSRSARSGRRRLIAAPPVAPAAACGASVAPRPAIERHGAVDRDGTIRLSRSTQRSRRAALLPRGAAARSPRARCRRGGAAAAAARAQRLVQAAEIDQQRPGATATNRSQRRPRPPGRGAITRRSRAGRAGLRHAAARTASGATARCHSQATQRPDAAARRAAPLARRRVRSARRGAARAPPARRRRPAAAPARCVRPANSSAGGRSAPSGDGHQQPSQTGVVRPPYQATRRAGRRTSRP